MMTAADSLLCPPHVAGSIDAGWAGYSPASGDGKPQWWALAIGHAPGGVLRAVSFIDASCSPRRERGAYPWDAVSWLSVAEDGLWIAATAGHYTHVRLATECADLRYKLHQVRLTD
jgi:hypothetical protein